MATISITETMLLAVLRAFVLTLVDCEVVRGLQNGVPMPKGEFIVLTPLSAPPLSTNVQTYAANASVYTRPTQWNVQIDCYGTQANDRAAIVSTLLRSAYGCEQFAASGLQIQPLYAGDAKQLPFVNGETQYEERWEFEAVLQYNPTISVPQDFADALVVGLINVDATFPPGA